MSCADCIYAVAYCADCDECFMHYCRVQNGKRHEGCVCDLIGHNAALCPFFLSELELNRKREAVLKTNGL